MEKREFTNNCGRKLLLNEEEGIVWYMGLADDACCGNVSIKFPREKKLHFMARYSKYVSTFSVLVQLWLAGPSTFPIFVETSFRR